MPQSENSFGVIPTSFGKPRGIFISAVIVPIQSPPSASKVVASRGLAPKSS